MKNELIITDHVWDGSLEKIVRDAWVFYSQHVPNKELLKVVDNGDGSHDIEYDGIEIGSYGIRSCDFLKWIYGTGLAEPRFSSLMRKYELSQEKN